MKLECFLYFFCLLWLSFDQKIPSEWWAPRIAQPPTAAVYELVPKLSAWLMNGSASPGDEILRAGSHQPLSQKPFNGPNAVHPPGAAWLVRPVRLPPFADGTVIGIAVSRPFVITVETMKLRAVTQYLGFHHVLLQRNTFARVALWDSFFFFFLQIDKRNQVHIAID